MLSSHSKRPWPGGVVPIVLFLSWGLFSATALSAHEHSPETIRWTSDNPADADTVQEQVEHIRSLGATNAVPGETSLRAGAENELLVEVGIALESDAPRIARERLLLEAARALGAVGGSDCLPALADLAARTPEAVYEAIGCRTYEPHYAFDFAREAELAASAVKRRLGAQSVEAQRGLLDLDAIRDIVDGAEDADILRGALEAADSAIRALSDTLADEAWGVLARDEEVMSSLLDEHANTIIDVVNERDYIDILADIVDALPDAQARRGAMAFGSNRATATDRDAYTEDVLDFLRDRPETLGSLALGLLNGDGLSSGLIDEAFDAADNWIDDRDLGADAARALARLDKDRAVEFAGGVWDDPDATIAELRRGVLILLDVETPEARAKLDELVDRLDAPDAELDKAVRELLEEVKSGLDA